MSVDLAQAHILGQQRLREMLAGMVAAAWAGLPDYDRENVDQWLAMVVPLVLAAQRQSVALTGAYLARALERQPLGVDPAQLIGAAARNGTPPDEEWQRPFVTVWTALGNGVTYPDAVASGLHRATGLAAMDVQLSSRATYSAVQEADSRIRGYRRVADSAACKFCRMVNGAFVKSAHAMALHNRCGCSLEPVTDPVKPTPVPAGVAVHDHGELGPLLTDPAHHFTVL